MQIQPSRQLIQPRAKGNMKEQVKLQPISKEHSDWLKSTIRDVPDFPKAGIVFKDLTTLLKDPKAFAFVIDTLAERATTLKPQYIAGIEARGFILGAAVAHKLQLGFVPIRKPGKLPHKKEKITYDLEYGTDTVEIHADAVEAGSSVFLIDDLLATGGTAAASIQLLRVIRANVTGVAFITELSFLDGRKKLPQDIEIFSMISY